MLEGWTDWECMDKNNPLIWNMPPMSDGGGRGGFRWVQLNRCIVAASDF